MNQVSIIIPVHNTPEEYLRECLHSVLRQDYTNWEAILIDDGSTSGAERICDEYAAKDARFCVIHQRQSGVSAARNAGMAAANGDWLIFSGFRRLVGGQSAVIRNEKAGGRTGGSAGV